MSIREKIFGFQNYLGEAFTLNSKFLEIQNKLAEQSKKRAFNYSKRMALYRKLERMTSEPAALPIYEALYELQTLEDTKGKKSSMWYLLDDVMQQLRSTKDSFSICFGKFIPENDVMVLAAAENDDLALGFKSLIESNKKSRMMKKIFISAIRYPCILLAIILLVIIGFSIGLIPQFTEMITPETTLSPLSSFLIYMSKYLPIWLPILLVSAISLIGFVSWALPNLNKYRLKLENIPPFNMYRIMTGSTFIFALNSLAKAGYSPQESLHEMKDLSKPYLRHRIEVYLDLMADGKDLGDALYESQLNFPDKDMVKELSIQTKYSDEDNSLEILSEVLFEDGLEVIQKQANLINGIMTLFIATVVITLYLGIMILGQDAAGVGKISNF